MKFYFNYFYTFEKYKLWCKDNNLKPSNYKNLLEYKYHLADVVARCIEKEYQNEIISNII